MVGALRVGLERSADRFAAHGDGFNHHPGELLSVAILAPGFLFRTHFVNDDFRATAVGHHLQRHTGIFDVGWPSVVAVPFFTSSTLSSLIVSSTSAWILSRSCSFVCSQTWCLRLQRWRRHRLQRFQPKRKLRVWSCFWQFPSQRWFWRTLTPPQQRCRGQRAWCRPWGRDAVRLGMHRI